jgi:hypothetical protein
MATVAELAAMYRQRIPTGATASTQVARRTSPYENMLKERAARQQEQSRTGQKPGVARRTSPYDNMLTDRSVRQGTDKTGPRGASYQDLVDVARFGLKALPRTVVKSTAKPYTLPSGVGQRLTSELIGGPSPYIGEKYAGFETRSDLLAAPEGEADYIYGIARLAEQQAAEAADRHFYDRNRQVAGQLSSIAGLAGVRPGANLSTADREQLMRGYRGVREFGETPEYEAALDVPLEYQQMYGGRPANEIMRQAYETMLNAPRLGRDEQAAASERAISGLGWFPEANQMMEAQMAGDPNVAGPQQLAQLIKSTPFSQYAQQVAINKYGMDPMLAAALYPRSLDADYANMQDEADLAEAGFRNESMAEYIFRNDGQDAYDQWMRQKADEALYGSASEQEAYLKALEEDANLQFDQQIADNYGFYPSDIKGIPADEVRARASDPVFQEYLAKGIDAIQGGDFGDMVGAAEAQNYITQTGDRVGARILAQAIATFDVRL